MNLDLFEDVQPGPLEFEGKARGQGYQAVAGIDEAGRGPLAGPVVAAAVVLPPQFDLAGLTDSKQLSPKKRDELFPRIRQQSVAYGIGLSHAPQVDHLNILQATLAAMQAAVHRLKQPADYLLIDGITPLPMSLPQQTLKKGDRRSLSIAAASVLAKVVRDRLMIHYDRVYPGYGFAGHKGYGTREHLRAIETLGPCPIHRMTFGGVREHVRPV